MRPLNTRRGVCGGCCGESPRGAGAGGARRQWGAAPVKPAFCEDIMDFITIGNVKIEKTCALSPMATRRQTFPADFKTAAASVFVSEAIASSPMTPTLI